MFRKIIFFLLIFCLPFQLGYHFWLPQSFVSSFRIDYLSPTLYLVDLLIFCYLIPNLYRLKINPLFVTVAILNLWLTRGNPITLFAWFRLFEYYFLFQALRSEANLITNARKPFLLSLGVILSLSIVQFVLQSSVGGPFYFFGERQLSVLLPNIAKLNLPSAICHLPSAICQILRPYSTFSHPNSLAGYLLITLVLLPLFTRSRILKYIISFVIFLTFSKSAIATLFIITFMNLSISQSLALCLLFSLTVFLSPTANFPNWLRQSFISRHYLIRPSLQILNDHWLTGIGLRQFIPTLTKYLPGNQLSYTTLQPIHNSFLLIVAEVGLAGLMVFYKLISKIILPLPNKPESRRYLFKIIAVILLTGSLDHYWWTLPQNQLIIVLAIALITNMSHTSYKTNKTHDFF